VNERAGLPRAAGDEGGLNWLEVVGDAEPGPAS
jgi:hypothetical protein